MVVREKNCYYAIALTDFFVFLSCAEIRDNHKKIVITGKYDERRQIDGIPLIYIVDWLLESNY